MKKPSEILRLAAATVGATQCPFPVQPRQNEIVITFPRTHFSCVRKFCRAIGQRVIVRRANKSYNVAVEVPAPDVEIWPEWPYAAAVIASGWVKNWKFAPELMAKARFETVDRWREVRHGHSVECLPPGFAA